MNHRVDRKGFVKADFLSSSGIRDGGGGGFNEIDLPFSAFSSASSYFSLGGSLQKFSTVSK